MIKVLLNHKWAVILAVLIGLIITLPQIYFRIAHQDIYQGINLSGPDLETYSMRVQEVRDGYFSIASPAWLEGKDLPYLLTPLSEIISSLLGSIFGLDITNTAILARFVFPFFIFLFIYILIYQWIKKKSIALTAAATVSLSTNLVSFKELWNLFFTDQKTLQFFLPMARFIIPQVPIFFFFGFLVLFWFFLKRNNWFYGIISGIILGLSFYVYPYTWTFLFAFLGCLILVFIFTKQWIKIKNILLIFVIALLVTIPFFWNLWQAMNHPFYADASLRYGMVKGHTPQVGLIVSITLIIFLLFFTRKQKEKYYFCLALVLTPLIVLNQQVITGIVLAPAHYHWYFHKPLAIIFLIIILFEQLDKRIKKPNFKKICCFSLVAIIFAVNFYNAWIVQSYSYKLKEPITIEFNQRYGSVLDWFNNNAKKDEVVVAVDPVSYLIPVYTSLNSAIADEGRLSLMANDEQIFERNFLEMCFNGLTAENAEEFFFSNRRMISGMFYAQYYRRNFGGYEKIPDERLYFLIEQYKIFLSVPLEEILRKYQVNYLVWDIEKSPEWQIDKYPFFKQIYQVGDVKIYELL